MENEKKWDPYNYNAINFNKYRVNRNRVYSDFNIYIFKYQEKRTNHNKRKKTI